MVRGIIMYLLLLVYLTFGILTNFALKEDMKKLMGNDKMTWKYKAGLLVASLIFWPFLFLFSLIYVFLNIVKKILDVSKFVKQKFRGK